MTEDEMVGWHHRLDGHGFGWTPRIGDVIQPSHPLSFPSPPAPNPSQRESFPMSHLLGTSASPNSGVLVTSVNP